MRILYLVFCFFLILACNNSQNKKKSFPTENEIIQIPDSLLGKDWEGNEILVGKVSLAQLSTYTSDWYSNEYDLYKTNQSLLTKIKPLLNNKKVTLIMGTWCEDSQQIGRAHV